MCRLSVNFRHTVWMFGGLKTFFHRVNWLDFRIIFRCILRYWDFFICFNRRKLVQRYLNWCEQETRNDVWWIFCGSNKQGQVDYCKAQNCWVLLVPNWFCQTDLRGWTMSEKGTLFPCTKCCYTFITYRLGMYFGNWAHQFIINGPKKRLILYVTAFTLLSRLSWHNCLQLCMGIHAESFISSSFPLHFLLPIWQHNV